MQIIWKIDTIVLNFNKCNSKIIYIYKIKLVEENTLKKQKKTTSKQVFCFTYFINLVLLTPQNFFLKIKNCFLEFSIQAQIFFSKNIKNIFKSCSKKLVFKTNIENISQT